jgi:hypothetical protein
MIVRTSVRHLTSGDVLAGSGFTLTHTPYPSVRGRKGYLWVEGFYPNGAVKCREWNASTTVSVVR